MNLKHFENNMLKNFIHNQQFCADNNLKYISSVNKYSNIINDAINAYKLYIDICDAREYLFYLSNLTNKIAEIVGINKCVPGLVMTYGTMNYSKNISFGNRKEKDEMQKKILPMEEDTIFDIASITKLFTAIIILKLIEEKILNFDDIIVSIDNRFVNLKNITIKDLLSFQYKLETKKRIDECKNKKEAEELLFNITPTENSGKKVYSDIDAIILKYIVEKVTNNKFWDVIKQYILIPLGMNDTYVKVPKEKLYRVASNNYEYIQENDKYIVQKDNYLGRVHDKKARILNESGEDLQGHSGIFSTINDIKKFCIGIIEKNILNEDLLNEIGINRTGLKLKNEEWRQFLGYQVYSKHINEIDSEVNHILSGNAFALSGYTGMHITIDIKNKVFVFIATNRCHNRISKSNIINNRTYDIIPMQQVNKKGDMKNFSYNYVYLKDKYVLNETIDLLLKYRVLEKLYEEY